MSSSQSRRPSKKDRGIWSGIFPQQGPIRQASESEILKAVQTVMRNQAGVIRLLEKE